MSLMMNEIIVLLKEHNLLKSINIYDNNDSFNSINYDSRFIHKNGLFFCKGNFHLKYLFDARKNGAIGYVSEKKYDDVNDMTSIIVSDIQKAMALLSAAFFNYPQNNLFIIAFTGTKGKTTSSYFTRSELQNAYHNRIAMFSTIDTFLGNDSSQKFKSKLTTPESLDIFKNMYKAVNNGMTYLVMEVSSQAYLKNRVYGLHYDVGFFLNITPDHIGPNEHPNFANYLHCKEQLLINSNICVINAETKHLDSIYNVAKTTTNPNNVYLFSRAGIEYSNKFPIDFTFKSLKDSMSSNEIEFDNVSSKAKKFNLNANYNLSLPGDYNESNAAAAIIAAGLSNANISSIQKGLRKVFVPGRMERYNAGRHGEVYVDYAHNYASMYALLSFLRRENKTGNVIVVIGSTGNKGVDRRTGFGKVLTQQANVAYLTTDDPAFEDPMKIAQQIDDAIDHQKVEVHFIMNRKDAIFNAIKFAKSEDMIVIAGKGRDPYQKINGVDVPYETDSVVVQNILKGF